MKIKLLPSAIFVLFGATGDLAQRKILPALFNLFIADELPDQFVVLCIGRRDWQTEEISGIYHDAVKRYSRRGEPDEAQWNRFAKNLSYLRAELNTQESYLRLARRADDIAHDWGETPEVIHYLAVPPDLIGIIADGIGKSGLAADRAHARVVVEKPLGRDLATFTAINQSLSLHFEEAQIFRIDHYLGKETVQNILALRFGNPMFEPIWNRQFVDHVAITVAESEGIGTRGEYYEEAGALRDMIQNHLLQLLCLVAMEPPSDYTAVDLRNRKMDVMRAILPIDPAEVPTIAVRGQYGAGNGTKAYREEEGVANDSSVETFAALKLGIENWRWQGVPFYLRSGKRLAEDRSEIAIRFRRVPHCFFPDCQGLNEQPAELLFQIQPDQGVLIHLAAKVPGYKLQLRPVTVQFSYAQAFGREIPEAYETLLHEILIGDATLFMRSDQVEAAWRLLDPVLKVWANETPQFPNYAAGSWGPAAADSLIQHDGRAWRYVGCALRT